ncbi:MAG TPA: DUF4236 domain-containing protein [Anaerolineales bacterium]|nr:DUF4236 domain-containing protein [Anaerolineales bacterium]
MPIRFRKSFTLFPGVKVNVSKGGTSITVGKKGFHLNFSKRGVRQTVGLPGSGFSESSYLFKEEEDKKEAEKEKRATETEDKPKRRTRRTLREHATSPWGFFAFVLIALFFFYFGARALGLIPPNLIADLLHMLTQWAQRMGL